MKYIYCYTNTKNGKNMLDKRRTYEEERESTEGRLVMSETGCSAETVRRINLGITHFSEEENYPLRKPVSTMEGQSSSRGAIDTHLETDIGH